MIQSDPGLIETPLASPVPSTNFFAGYAQDPALILEKTFEEIEGYDEMIVLRGVSALRAIASTTWRRSPVRPGWRTCRAVA